MSDRPEFDLEALLKAEEAEIRDDGFSARVAERAERSAKVRRFAVVGAGLMGAGFAAGGLTQMFPYMSKPAEPTAAGHGFSDWWSQAVGAVQNADASIDAALGAASSGQLSGAALLVAAAVAAGLLFTLLGMMSAQSR